MSTKRNGNFEKFIDAILCVYEEHIEKGGLTGEQAVGAMYAALAVAQDVLRDRLHQQHKEQL